MLCIGQAERPTEAAAEAIFATLFIGRGAAEATFSDFLTRTYTAAQLPNPTFIYKACMRQMYNEVSGNLG